MLQKFYLEQFQRQFEVKDSANVAYFRFNSLWYRLYFDGGTIFWREGQQPTEATNSTFDSALVLVNLNEMETVVGSIIKSINYGSTESEVSAELAFSSGITLKFIHNGDLDRTRIEC